MNSKKEISKKWFEFAARDLRDAEILFKNKSYKGCILHCHQTLEKYLKSVIVENNKLMAIISNQAKKIAKSYVKKLESKLPVKKALLFGSAARGKMNKNSDIDIIVISDNFKKMKLINRLVFLSRFRGEEFLDWPMDILGYTPKEFEKLSKVSTMFSEAKKEGVVIK